MSITIFENIQKELRIDAATGVGYCSIRGAARICGVDQESIRKSLKSGADFIASKMAQSLILQGFEGADFIEFSVSGIPDSALALIVHYYAIEAGSRCTEEAKAALLAFTTIGIRTVIQKVCKHEEPVQAPILISPQENLKNLLATREMLEAIGLDINNPRFAQDFRDLTCRVLGLGSQALPAASGEKWLGVVEKAEDLGYNHAIASRFGSALGRDVSKKGGDLEQTTDTRICNGRNTPIKLYRDCDRLTELVASYMDRKISQLEKEGGN